MANHYTRQIPLSEAQRQDCSADGATAQALVLPRIVLETAAGKK